LIGQLLQERLEKSWKVAGPSITILFGRMVIRSDWPTLSFASGDIFDSTLWLKVGDWSDDFWLSQANHIFSRLGITSNFEDYGASETILAEFLINSFN
jgi:hypothetical protein